MKKTAEITDFRRRSDEMAKLATLRDLRLTDIQAKLLRPSRREPFTPSTSIEPEVTRLNNFAIYNVTYKFDAIDGGGAEVFHISFVFNIVFEVKRLSEVSDTDLGAFGAVGVLEIAHPYVRELVHSLTSRMSLPPFVLDVAAPIGAQPK